MHRHKEDQTLLSGIHRLGELTEVAALRLVFTHTGGVDVFGAVAEDFLEVFVPAFVYYRPVGDDEGRLIVHLTGYLQTAQGLAETHLGIPQKCLAGGLLKVIHRGVDGFTLLRTEFDLAITGTAAALDGFDGFDHIAQLAGKPDVGLLAIDFVERLIGYTVLLQCAVHIVGFVTLGFICVSGAFHMLYVVVYTLKITAVFQGFAHNFGQCCLVIVVGHIVVYKHFAYLQRSLWLST